MHWNTMGWPWVVGKTPLTIIMVEGTAGFVSWFANEEVVRVSRLLLVVNGFMCTCPGFRESYIQHNHSTITALLLLMQVLR